ncbi:GAF domain-containing protein [Rhodococcus fascians]|nr:GAF domain-containing protein [Rhodococcus fascians]MBY3998840.1 GAF domain-containing protein [Rhodococcus fascians]MBY4003564.1 GAF domain-containing protein [Rhodococcus fascians]MBY4008314.1 GAF domain-containing protein [Rhodococcus fascians]MBY4018447.1 GAF domain-containing protein [Rhodococcus fascians]
MPDAVYRAPMPNGVERALTYGLCGMTANDERSLRRVERFEEVPDGSFVWTRTPRGEYFLGRISGPLREDRSADAVASNMIFVRDCQWTSAPVPEAEVPMATLQTFARGGRNFQQTHDPRVGSDSASVWRARGR